ncbi:MAG: protein kinase, partial [Phycisphaerae bacterium]|nr:protein kinase [Phycisphaerae bacterium]
RCLVGSEMCIRDRQREGSGRPLVTMPGQILGTIRYMSPEQARGDPEAVDTRTDVYSLGVILYEALTRAAPYPTNLELASALRNIQEMDPSRPSRLCREVNSELDAIVLKAMHKDPDRRYASAAELGEDLKAWLEGRPVSAKSDSSLYVLRKLASRHRFETSVVVALIAAIVSIAGISLEFYRRERTASRDLEQANRIIGEKYTQLQNEQQETAAGAQRAIGTYVLGWFLLEYHAGRSDHARAIMDQTAKMSPACAAAMAFLMDESYSVERLRSELPADSADLLEFMIGEKALKAHRLSEARQAFSRCSELPGGEWLKSAARARLRELGPLPKASAARGPY